MYNPSTHFTQYYSQNHLLVIYNLILNIEEFSNIHTSYTLPITTNNQIKTNLPSSHTQHIYTVITTNIHTFNTLLNFFNFLYKTQKCKIKIYVFWGIIHVIYSDMVTSLKFRAQCEADMSNSCDVLLNLVTFQYMYLWRQAIKIHINTVPLS